MFITPSKVFRHADRLAGWQGGEKAPPVTIEWDLSNRCHLGCQSCHFAHTHVKGPWKSKARILPMAYDGTGDLADLHLIERAAWEMASAGVKGIVWSGGGEPTTHPQWREALAWTSAAGLEQGMYTAGGLLTQEDASWLAHYATFVVVSLDCLDRETYKAEKGLDHFEKACQAIRWLAEARATTVGVSFLLHSGNFFHAPRMLALARSLGATYTTFRPTILTHANAPAICTESRDWINGAIVLLPELAQEPDVELDLARFRAYRDWMGHTYDACYGIRLTATVTPDGRMWVCPQRRGIAGSCLGDLSTESFADIWARHPGEWNDFSECRVMCRLHQVNSQLAGVFTPRAHEAFV